MDANKINRIKTVKIISKFIISIMLILTVIVGYLPEPQYIIELTCISNFLIGVIFLISGIRALLGKKELSNLFYSCGLVTIMCVFLICMGSLTGMYHMNFKGAFLFLHVINPLVILLYYMIFVNEKKYGKAKNILFTPCATLVYLVIDYVSGRFRGNFVYGFSKVEDLTIVLAILIGIVIYIALLSIGYLLYMLNMLLGKQKEI